MIKKFAEIFYPYREQNIALYGLGNITGEILEQAETEFHIIGLLDGYRTEGEMYNRPIFSMEEVITKKITVIIIVARPSSCRIIVNRIGTFCRENNIKLLDLNGNDLLDNTSDNVTVSFSAGSSKKELLKKIDSSEVISFDLFDTLIMRKTLYPDDIFEIVEKKLPLYFRKKLQFSRERQLAERECARKAAPTWEEIYNCLGKKNKLSECEKEKLKELEWETEKLLITTRKEMYQVFQYALKQGKRVYLVSDMYFSVQQMTELLEQMEIIGYEKLIISCEYGSTKEKGLFRCLIQEVGSTSILHIGDNQRADVDSAEKNSIEGIKIFSALDMFEKSGLKRKLNRQNALEERIKLGMFIAKIFNSPFLPENGVAEIRDPETLGYLFFAPALTDFTFWLWHKVKENREETLLFGARDGYLIKQLFDKLQEKAGKVTKSVYFMTSRICAVLSGIYEDKDIDCVVSMGFSGSFEQMLKTRFLLTDNEMKAAGSFEGCRQLILKKAHEKRENYLEYIRGLKLGDGRKAFFDFVSTGTCQLALEKILEQKMQGYFFIQVPEDNKEKKELNIQSFYPFKATEKGGSIYEDYFLLENILTSGQPSVQGFDNMGKPVYMSEDRTEDEILFLEKVQDGVRKYFGEYLKIMGAEKADGSPELSEALLKLIHIVAVKDKIFKEMKWEDAFRGRAVTVGEML